MPRPLPFVLGAALALAACSGSPAYYLLSPPETAARAASPARSIAVADISLPAYAEALEIASIGPTGAVTLDRDALWADTPRRALTRHLVAALQTRLDAVIGTEPWPGFDQPGLRVEVAVDRMIGAPEGALQFTGQYVIVSPASGRILASERFAITLPPPGPGYQGLIDAHGRAIEALADTIAGRVARVGRGLA
jgi:uncharacterized lipoprotein YmbA